MQTYLFFDTETTGLPTDYKAPLTDGEKWPRMVQLAARVIRDHENGETEDLFQLNWIIYPEGYSIPDEVAKLHGITTQIAIKKGHDLTATLSAFEYFTTQAGIMVGHNVAFDRKIVGAEFHRKGFPDPMHGFPRMCTMIKGTQFCQLPNKSGTNFKWPKLEELARKLFPTDTIEPGSLHNAWNDLNLTVRCFFEMRRRGIIDQHDISKAYRNTNETF